MKKVVQKRKLTDDEDAQRVEYWLSRPPIERWNAISDLRVAYMMAHGITPGKIEKVVKIYPLSEQ